MSDNVESYVSPICLPWNSKGPGYSTTAGQELTATGWETATNNKDMVNEVEFNHEFEIWISPAFNGITYKLFYHFQNYLGAAKGILRKVTLFAQDEEFCKRFYTSANYSTQFCAGGERGENKSNGGTQYKVIIC